MKNFRADEGGVSIVISVLMLLAIFIGVYAMYMAVSIPQEFASKEKEHMSEVRDSFIELRSAIQQMSENEARSIAVPMSTNLFSGVIRGPSIAGRLSVALSAADNIITFDIQNAYYLSQSYAYENGAVILFQSQDNRSMMVSNPPLIAVTRMDEDNIQVTIQTIRLLGSSNIISTGTATITATVENVVTSETENTDNLVITVHSTYRDAWGEYLKKRAKELRAPPYNIENVAVDLESLQLTIYRTDPSGENAIFYNWTCREVSVTVW